MKLTKIQCDNESSQQDVTAPILDDNEIRNRTDEAASRTFQENPPAEPSTLDLSPTHFTYLPTEIGNLIPLKYLKLSNKYL